MNQEYIFYESYFLVLMYQTDQYRRLRSIVNVEAAMEIKKNREPLLLLLLFYTKFLSDILHNYI